MIIKNGTLRSGSYVLSGDVYAPVRIMEDFMGKPIKEASLSEPIGIVGFTGVPQIGGDFITVDSKKEAEAILAQKKQSISHTMKFEKSNLPFVPLLIKVDMLGTIDAIKHELSKFESDRIAVRVIGASVGDISPLDVQTVSATKDAIIVGFNVKVERAAAELATRLNVEIDTFDIIYELSDWLNTALKNRTPKKEEEVVTGKAKILKEFSTQKFTHVLGGRMEEGTLKLKQTVRIIRRDIEIGKGTIVNLQQTKSDTSSVSDGEFGMQITTKAELAPGDTLEGLDIVVT
jgi:translation initiation factor IF-2